MPARSSIQNTSADAAFQSRPVAKTSARKWSARRIFLVVVVTSAVCWSLILYFLYFLVRRMF